MREGGEEGCGADQIRAATSYKMTTIVIFLLLAQQLTAKPLIAGVVEGGDRHSEQQRYRALTAEQKENINQQIEILTHQERLDGAQVIII